jgi:hypothetical protein
MKRSNSFDGDDDDEDDNDDEDDEHDEHGNYKNNKTEVYSKWSDFDIYLCPLYCFYCFYDQEEVKIWFQMRNAAMLLDEIKTARRQLIREITKKEQEYDPENDEFNEKIDKFRSSVKNKIIYDDIASFTRSLSGPELRKFNHIRRQETRLENLGTSINVYKEINERLLENETSLDTINREYISYQKLRDKQALFKYINKVDVSSVISKTKKNMMKINQMMNDKSKISKYGDLSKITKQVVFGNNYNSNPSSNLLNKFLVEKNIPNVKSTVDLPNENETLINKKNKTKLVNS